MCDVFIYDRIRICYWVMHVMYDRVACGLLLLLGDYYLCVVVITKGVFVAVLFDTCVCLFMCITL
jgi:hypothetical protein